MIHLNINVDKIIALYVRESRNANKICFSTVPVVALIIMDENLLLVAMDKNAQRSNLHNKFLSQ